MKKLFRIFKIRFSRRRLKRISRNTLVAYLIVSTVLVGTGLIFLLLPYFTSKEVEAAWFNDNWSYRQRIDVTNSGSAQTDFQVPFVMNTSTLISAGKMQGGCQDIRVTDISGRILPYWIEKQAGAACNTTTTKIWTKMPAIGTTGNTLFVYYGNASVLSAENGNATFIYFDDFNANINSGLWTVADATGTQITFSGGRMNFVTGNQTWGQAAYLTPSIARGETTFEADFLPAVTGHFMSGWKDDGAGASYANLVYGYYEPSATNVIIYEDGGGGYAGTGTWTQGTNYKIRMRMRASGGNYYDQSTNGGINFTNSYTSTYSTESTLHPGFTLYSGTTYIDNFFVRKDATTAPSAAAPTNEEKAPTAVGYWKFDEGTGTVARTSATPGFSPKDLSGLALWLDANAPGSITLATGVSQWNDLSGNARNFTQSTGSQQPSYVQNVLNGKPVVQFAAASSQTMSNSTNFSTPNTVIYVSRQTGGTNGRVLSGLADNWLMGYHNTRRQQAYFNGWVLGNGTGPTSTTNWYIYSSTQTGSLSTFWENGTQLASNANGVAGPNGLSLNGHASVSEFSDAQIAEVIVYNRVITDNERQRVEAYLASKWGQSSSLINTNPFYNQSALSGADGIMSNFTSPPSATSGWQTEDQCISSKCLNFDGADDVVNSGSPSSLDDLPAITAEAWVYPRTYGETAGFILNKSTGASVTAGWVLALADAPVLGRSKALQFIVDGSTDVYRITADNVVSYNAWNHIVVTWDGVMSTGSSIHIYVNGKEVPSYVTTQNGANRVSDASTDLLIGNSTTGDRAFDGKIDEARIYNYVRSSAQILADYNSRQNPEGVSQQQGNNIQNMPSALSNGLAAYWRFNETSGTAADSSGNGLTATLGASDSYTGAKFGNGINNTGSGAGASLTYAASSSIDFGSTSKPTIAFWYKSSTASQTTRLLEATSTGGWGLEIISGTLQINSFNVGSASFGQTMPSDGVWHHFTITFEGTNARMYKDGALVSTVVFSSAWSSGSKTLYILGDASFPTTATIDDLRIYNRPLSDGDVKLLYNWAPGPVGYWKLEEGSGASAYDSSGYVNTGTITAGSGGYTAGKYGKGYNFDGASTIINAGSASSLDNLPAAGMTAETWYYARSLGESSVGFILSKNTGASQNAGWFLINYGTNSIQFVVDGSTDLVVNTSNNALVLNRWNHIALSWDGVITTASSVHIYINGVESTYQTQTNGAGRVDDASSSFYIGNASTQDRTVDGIIDETKLYNYPRTAGQITEDLNASHPAPGSPVSSSTAYWKFDEGYNTTANNSGAGGTGYAGTMASFSSPATSTSGWTASGKVGKSLIFDGSDDIVTTTGFPDAYFTGDWSQTFWIKTTQSGNKVLTEKGSNNAFVQTNTGQIRAGTTGNASLDVIDTTGSPLITDGSWHHVAVTYSATSNFLAAYIDGVQRGSKTVTNDSASSATAFAIGARVGPSAAFAGQLDEMKIFDSTLTADQVKLDMNQGSAQALGSLSSSQTVPTAAASEYCIPGDSTACTAPVARWDYEQGTGSSAYDTSGNANTGTITNATWSPGKTGKGLGFDGTGDYMTAADSTSLELGSGDFTIQSWIYLTAYPNSGFGAAIYAKDSGTAVFAPLDIVIRDTATDAQHDIHVWATTANGSWNVLNDIDFGGGSQLTLNAWHQVSFVRSSGSCKLYVDGVVTSTSSAGISCSGTLYDNANTLYMGGQFQSTSGSGGITGRMDNYRIFNYARSYAQVQWDYNKGAPSAYWRLDDCQGTTANDSSGNGYSGTISIGGTGTYTTPGTCSVSSASSAWYNGATGKRNYSLAFDGTDDIITASGLPAGFFTTSWSQALWMKSTASGNYVITEKGTNNALVQLISSIIRAGTTSTSGDFYDTTQAVNDGNWHHIVVTENSSTKVMNTYIDGIRRAGATVGNNAASSATAFAIGARVGPSLGFPGQLDDVRVYNYDLTATQVKTLYSEGVARYGPVTGAP